MASPKICKVDGCGKAANARFLCNAHYAQWRRSQPIPESKLVQWLRSNVMYSGDECLFWPFGRNDLGYGILEYCGRNIIASRLMCTFAKGSPPTPQA